MMLSNAKRYLGFIYSALLFACTIAFAMPASSAESDTEPACELAYANDRAEIEICHIAPQVIVVNAHVISSGKTISAEFDLATNQDRRYSFDRPFWRRFWISSGSAVLTQDEQGDLITLQDPAFASTRRFSQEEIAAARSVMKFLVGFVEPGTKLETFNQRKPHRSRNLNNFIGSGITMICEFIGKEHRAEYSAKSNVIQSLVLVGAEESRCRGRCGFGCPFFGGNAGQYTQECLNHDVCHTERGEQLGECADEFWTAAASYVSAPDCK